MAQQNNNPEKPTIFISYSHDSSEHIDAVLALSNRLRDHGIDCILDQYETSPPEGWITWMDRHIRDAHFVLMVCTPTYYRRVMLDEQPGDGLGVKWEGKLIKQHIYYADSANHRFIPIGLGSLAVEHIPDCLRDASRYDVTSQAGYLNLYRHITNQPRVEKPELGKLITLSRRPRQVDFPAGYDSSSLNIFTSKLPTTSGDLFGRDAELDTLDNLWSDDQANVVSFVAWGGVGKTALVNKWLNYRMALDNYRGAQTVFGWSFYSQGADASRQVSGDDFIAAALPFFGDPNPTEGSAWDKGARLAQLVAAQKTLLILDGLEPLQNPPGHNQGQITDPAVASLLRGLATRNDGLCVVSTRIAIADLDGRPDSLVKEIDLEDLSPPAGAEVLRKQGVVGPQAELEKTSQEFAGHALALTLLGNYLATVHDGDVRKRDDVPKLTDDQEQGGHAKRVMQSYEIWLAGKPELDILYILGLFDRPAEQPAIDTLRQEPAITGLTDTLIPLSEADWKFAIKHLQGLHLLGDADDDVLDCHPLVREYFSDRLKDSQPDGWRQAHERLYEYYKQTAKELPDTIEEMAPLYRAVTHGCAAGRHQDAFSNVYLARIRRGNEHYNINKLGAFGSDLACIAGFFADLWHRPVPGLPEPDKGFILNQAGYDLRALGRLREAIEPIKASLDMYVKQKGWRNASIAVSNLSQLHHVLGHVAKAIEYASKSLEYADTSADEFQRATKRVGLANALHQAGQLDRARDMFEQAEAIQEKRQPNYPILYSVQGFEYCDLLLSLGRYEEVLERTSRTLEWVKEQNWLLDIGLDHLSLGRAHLAKAEKEGTRNFGQAEAHLNAALDGLRESGNLDDVPRGLMARADFGRITENFTLAHRDLDEAFELATRCEMRLHLTDCHLGYARLCIAENDRETAQTHIDKAATLINQTGYHRRDPDLAALRRTLT